MGGIFQDHTGNRDYDPGSVPLPVLRSRWRPRSILDEGATRVYEISCEQEDRRSRSARIEVDGVRERPIWDSYQHENGQKRTRTDSLVSGKETRNRDCLRPVRPSLRNIRRVRLVADNLGFEFLFPKPRLS